MELGKDYSEILGQAVAEIRTARQAIARKVNAAAMGFYWNLGRLLSEKKIEKGHGAGVVNRLSVDLKAEFPDMGLSPRNLWNMKRFNERYYDSDSKLQRSVAVLPWHHNLLLIEKIENDKEALYYAEKAIVLGWSRDIVGR
jgi:predicted nuclease of restriction endonuclease-like (RecB) superfamily